MIYPKNKKPEMVQLSGDTDKVEMLMQGKERIYSRDDTRRIIDLASKAKSVKDYLVLGKFVYDATKLQDSKAPQYTDK